MAGNEKKKRGALKLVSGLLILGVAVGFALIKRSCAIASVDCQAEESAVLCRVSLTTLNDDPTRVCWQVQVQCKNGSTAKAPRCLVTRRGQDDPVDVVPISALKPKGGCDAPSAASAGEITTKKLSL